MYIYSAYLAPVALIERLVMTRSMHDTTDIYLQPKTECAKMHGLAIGIKLWLAVNDHASVGLHGWAVRMN